MRHLAKKSLGQNFLVDGNYQKKIISALDLSSEYRGVLEIGPGQGAITQHLLPLDLPLVLVEKDVVLARKWQGEVAARDNSLCVAGDFLDQDLEQLFSSDNTPCAVVANLPYNVASQILIRLFENSAFFCDLFLMFQKEVAERCLASCGTKDFGPLAVWTQLFSEATRLFDLPPTVFKPRPRVWSSFVHFKLKAVDFSEHRDFLRFVRQVFTMRRKKLSTILKAQYRVDITTDEDLAVYKDARPEVLEVSELQRVFDKIRD